MRYKYIFKLIGFGKYEEIKEEIKEPRPFGFYWVKANGQWTIVEWCEAGWIYLGDIGLMKDEYFDKIYEFKIEEPMI